MMKNIARVKNAPNTAKHLLVPGYSFAVYIATRKEAAKSQYRKPRPEIRPSEASSDSSLQLVKFRFFVSVKLKVFLRNRRRKEITLIHDHEQAEYDETACRSGA